MEIFGNRQHIGDQRDLIDKNQVIYIELDLDKHTFKVKKTHKENNVLDIFTFKKDLVSSCSEIFQNKSKYLAFLPMVL